jgi:hypothetical protein
MSLTQERLKELLDYDPMTGVFRWRVGHPRKRMKVGDIAGCQHPTGTYVIGIERRFYQAHRLAWLWMLGEWPSGQVDHRDRDRGNNCWENLRLATASQNRANAKVNSNSLTGLKGVHYYAKYKKYGARIKKNGKKKWLGWYDTPEEAHACYWQEAQKLHGKFARAA